MEEVFNALRRLFRQIKALESGESANVLDLRREIFKATYGQDSFDLNAKADAGEALNYILEMLHTKLDKWVGETECKCEVHQATHCSTGHLIRCR